MLINNKLNSGPHSADPREEPPGSRWQCHCHLQEVAAAPKPSFLHFLRDSSSHFEFGSGHHPSLLPKQSGKSLTCNTSAGRVIQHISASKKGGVGAVCVCVQKSMLCYLSLDFARLKTHTCLLMEVSLGFFAKATPPLVAGVVLRQHSSCAQCSVC